MDARGFSPLTRCDTTAPPPSPIFSLPPEAMDAVLADLCNPNVSLLELAESYKTTVEALIAWMSKPDIQQRLADFQSASAFRTRLVATANLPKAVEALTQIIEAYIFEETKELVSPSTLAKEQRRRSRETARKASALLIRLSRFYPATAPTPRTPDRPTASPDRATASPLSPLESKSASRADHPTPPTPTPTSPPASVTSSLDHSVTSPPVPPLSLHDLRDLLLHLREQAAHSHLNQLPSTKGHATVDPTATPSPSTDPGSSVTPPTESPNPLSDPPLPTGAASQLSHNLPKAAVPP